MNPAAVDALTALARTTRHGLVVHDESGTVVWCNHAAAELLGLAFEELAGGRGFVCHERITHADGTPLEPGSLPPDVVVHADRDRAAAVIGLRLDGREVARWLQVESHRVVRRSQAGSAAIASVIVDISERHRTRSEVAATLRAFQLMLRPSCVPSIAGLDIDARCRPATGTLLGGGDFYDIVELDDGSHALFVGDVQGHGVGAATETSLARHTLRAAARHADDPATALRWLHEALVSSISTRSCTAVLGVVRPASDGFCVRFSIAGHPRPMLVVDGEPTTFVGRGGTLLGSVELDELPTNEVELHPGSALVCYSDGVTDSATPRLSDGDLLGAVGWKPSASEIVDLVLDAGARPDSTFPDDTAVIVMLVPPDGP